jgi:hypothetical protein
MKYLQDMGISEQAWKTRFGFDPGDVYPADPTALQRAARLADGGAPPPVDMGIDTPLFGDMHKSAGAYDNLAKGRTPNLRNSGGNLAKIAGDTIRRADEAARAERAVADGKDFMYKAGGAAAATGLGAAIGGGLAGPAPQPRKSVPPVELPAVDSTDGTADLAAEARPVPKVAPTPAVPEPNTVQASPRDQAKALMEQLNAMRRKAGGEVPEAKYMMAEIDRLLAMSNDNRNAPGYKPDGSPGDRAQALIQQLNAMRRQAGGEVPQAAQMMAEIRRLQAEDDAARNSGRPLPAPSRTPAPAPNLSRQGVRPGYNAKPLGGKPQAPGRIGPTGGYKRRSSPSTT